MHLIHLPSSLVEVGVVVVILGCVVGVGISAKYIILNKIYAIWV